MASRTQSEDVKRFIGAAFLFILVLLMTDALVPLFYGNATDMKRSDTTDSNPVKFAVSTLLMMTATLLLVWRPHLAKRLLVPGWIVVLLLALPFLSLGWSMDKATTLKRALAHMLTVFFAYYAVTYWKPESFLRILLAGLVAGCAVSDVLGVVWPAVSINHDPLSGNLGAWVGLYGDKIMSGGISAATVLLSIVVPARTPGEKLLRLTGLLSGGLLCAMSQSRTGWLEVIVGMMILGLAAILSTPGVTKGLKVGVTSVIAVVVGGGLIASVPYLLPILGRTATFSGRTTLWHGAIAVAETRNTWLGTGYRAFWTPENSSGVRGYIAYWEYLVGNAHNGYLDSWLEMGWLGAAILALFLVIVVVALVERILSQPRAWKWRGLFTLVLTFLMTNASYTLAFRHTNMFWAGCIVAYLYVVSSRVLETAPARVVRPGLRMRRAPSTPGVADAAA